MTQQTTWADTADGYLGMTELIPIACDADLRRVEYRANLVADLMRVCDVIRWTARTTPPEPDRGSSYT